MKHKQNTLYNVNNEINYLNNIGGHSPVIREKIRSGETTKKELYRKYKKAIAHRRWDFEGKDKIMRWLQKELVQVGANL